MKKHISLALLISSVFCICTAANTQHPKMYSQPNSSQDIELSQKTERRKSKEDKKRRQRYSNADASGMVVMEQSPIEALAMQPGVNEFRAYGDAESASEQLAYSAARALAISRLRATIEEYVRAGLEKETQVKTGTNAEYTLDESTREQVVTACKGIVNGARILNTRKLYNPSSKRYKYEICVTFDRANVLQTMLTQNESILNNKTQFEKDIQHAWDALDAQHNNANLEAQQAANENKPAKRSKKSLNSIVQSDISPSSAKFLGM